MSDPYAAALGLADPAPAAPPRAQGGPSAAEWHAASAAQRFDSNSAAIAAQEVAQAKTPGDRAAAVKTQAYTAAKIAQQGGVSPAAANDPYAQGLGLDATGKPVSSPAPSAAPATAAPTHWWQVTPEQQSQLDQAKVAEGNSAGPALLQAGAHAVTGMGASLYGLVRGAGAMAGGGSLQDMSDEISDAQKKYTYNPPEGSGGAALLNGVSIPLGLLSKGTQALGEKTLAATGSPLLATAADVGTNTLASLGVGKLLGKGLAPKESTLSGLTQPQRIEPTMPPESAMGATAQAAPVAAPAQVTAPAPQPTNLSLVPREPVPTQSPSVTPQTAPPPQPLGLAPQQPVPGKSVPFPGGTPEAPAAAVPGTAVAARPAEPEITPTEALKAGSALPDGEQAARAKVLQDIGFETSRDSAIQGDNRSRAVEYQMSKFQEPAGDAAAQQFATEVQTMGNYTRGLINDSGGSLGTDQAAMYSRGQTIVRPIQALRDWFNDKASGLYQAADEKAQGQSVSLGGFGSALQDPSNWTQPSHVLLKDATTSFAQKAGMTLGDDGSFSGTALQAETVRKYLNNAAKKDPTGALQGYVDTLKESLDDDVGKAAGGPIYDQSRQLWALRQKTIADPKGISSLLNEDGTNRAVPFERVPDNIMKMPQDQFAHIVGTLQNLPPELQGVGNAALGEIKSQFYNKMLEGASETRGGNARPFWNGTAVKGVIGDNSAKLQALMSPEELGKVDTLRKAGDILSFDPSYPGAAAQAQNAVKRGLMSNLVGHATTVAGAGAGALVGFPGAGAVLGRLAGEKAQAATGQRGALNKWQKGSVTLSNLLGDSR